MTQSARNAPTHVEVQLHDETRKSGNATANHASREPNRKSRAAASQFTAASCANTPRNVAPRLPGARGSRIADSSSASARPAASAALV